MALVGLARLLRGLVVFSATPQSGHLTGLKIFKDGRAVCNARFARGLYGDLNHVDTKQGRAGVPSDVTDAACKLFFFSNIRGAGIIDNDAFVIARND